MSVFYLSLKYFLNFHTLTKKEYKRLNFENNYE